MGKFLRQIGEEASFGSKAPPPGTFAIPHKVVLAVPQQLLCVADRENGRIQAFSLHDGSFRFQISLPEFMGQLYSVAYSDHAPGGLLFAVSGPMMISNPSRGFVFNLTSRELLGTFGPPKGSFTMPHDIACSKDVEEVYVGEISPNKLWRFVREVHRSTKKVLEAPPRQSNATAPPAVAPPIPEDNFGVSMVIMALLAIPILSFLVITIVVRLKRQGAFKMKRRVLKAVDCDKRVYFATKPGAQLRETMARAERDHRIWQAGTGMDMRGEETARSAINELEEELKRTPKGLTSREMERVVEELEKEAEDELIQQYTDVVNWMCKWITKVKGIRSGH
ncbi:hypothetical protein ISCGN_016648 [Ixodes scapularis]